MESGAFLSFCVVCRRLLNNLSCAVNNLHCVNGVNNSSVSILSNLLNRSLSLATARCERDGCYGSEHQNKLLHFFCF